MSEKQRTALKAMSAIAALLAAGGLWEGDERSLEAALKVTQSIVDGKS